jgi:DNA methylase
MKTPSQLDLPFTMTGESTTSRIPETNGKANKLDSQDRPFHDWYRFVLSYPPHLVRRYLQDFGLDGNSTVLDPFCGTGTTLIEAKLRGIHAIGLEANPFAHFASSVKVDWSIDPELLVMRAHDVAESALRVLKAQGIDDSQPFRGDLLDIPLKTLEPEVAKLLLTDSISPLPLHKTLVLLACLQEFANEPFFPHAELALANALVFKISNLRFGPEVGVGERREDAPVVAVWLSEIDRMADDLRRVAGKAYPACSVYLADAREISNLVPPRSDEIQSHSIDAVITSPPYPNEKDYTRTTRLESVLLGYVKSKADLRELKKRLVRSNTRGVYKEDDDDEWVEIPEEIRRIVESIESRRQELGKDSGFERMYGRVTRLYFAAMARHFIELRALLRPGAMLAYVVGDQASYLRVMIRTGKLLAEIAQAVGYELVRIDLFRTRFATATKEQLREEVVVLRWRGKKEDTTMPEEKNRYTKLIESIFFKHYKEGDLEIEFERSDLSRAAEKLKIVLPKNLGDVLYSFRYRTQLPESILAKAPAGSEWVIRAAGRARYKFVLAPKSTITPSTVLAETKILDATPGIIAKYALNDEQALLAKLRYNRLVDLFMGLTCYSLQNHLRTTVSGMGQVETDELYIGMDKRGAQYVMPVQAKAGTDRIGIVQIEQDIAMCAAKFPGLVCRPIAAQFMDENLIALFELEPTEKGIKVSTERHYRLVRPEELTPEELEKYRTRSE